MIQSSTLDTQVANTSVTGKYYLLLVLVLGEVYQKLIFGKCSMSVLYITV